MTETPVLLLHIPALHRGYVELFKRLTYKKPEVAILGEKILKEVRFLEKDISALDPLDAKKALDVLGFFNPAKILETPESLGSIKNRPIILINDQLSKRLAENFLSQSSIEWETCFLRWDESHVQKAVPVQSDAVSNNPEDIAMMKKAYREAAESGDWWRRVGTILVKNGDIIVRAHNTDLPSDQSSYQNGNIRDYIQSGKSPEFANAIHSESCAIAEAARTGTELEGATIYVTHFPCPMCAKAIAVAGLKRCVYGEGSANFDAEIMLKSFGIESVYCPITS